MGLYSWIQGWREVIVNTITLVTYSSISMITLLFGPIYPSTSMITQKVQVQVLRVWNTITPSLLGSPFYRLR